MRARPMRWGLTVCATLAVAMTLAVPAVARTHVVVGVGVGAPMAVYAPPPPVYYYPAPVYYPPPVVYAPAPPPSVVYAPAPSAPPPATPTAAPAPPPPQTGNCRQYRGDATIDGQNQPFYGTACQQSDGKWHIVN